MIDENTISKNLFLVYSLLIIGFLILVLSDKVSVQWINKPNIGSLTNGVTASPDCVGLSPERIVECVVDDVKGWYVYNRTKDSLNLSLDDLHRRGGDCKDWTQYYLETLSVYNFSGYPSIIYFDEGTAHEFAIVYKEGIYCTIDQTSYACFRLNVTVNDEN